VFKFIIWKRKLWYLDAKNEDCVKLFRCLRRTNKVWILSYYSCKTWKIEEKKIISYLG